MSVFSPAFRICLEKLNAGGPGPACFVCLGQPKTRRQEDRPFAATGFAVKGLVKKWKESDKKERSEC